MVILPFVTFETQCACSEADSFTRLMEGQAVVTLLHLLPGHYFDPLRPC